MVHRRCTGTEAMVQECMLYVRPVRNAQKQPGQEGVRIEGAERMPEADEVVSDESGKQQLGRSGGGRREPNSSGVAG